jgi:hypothetical protein
MNLAATDRVMAAATIFGDDEDDVAQVAFVGDDEDEEMDSGK